MPITTGASCFVLCFAGQSSPLSPFFKEIVTVLLAAAQRQDNNHVENTRLQISSFEAINDMVSAAALTTDGGVTWIVEALDTHRQCRTRLHCPQACVPFPGCFQQPCFKA